MMRRSLFLAFKIVVLMLIVAFTFTSCCVVDEQLTDELPFKTFVLREGMA